MNYFLKIKIWKFLIKKITINKINKRIDAVAIAFG